MRCTEEMKLWLFDLAHGNLDNNKIVSGFLKHYALYDMGIRDVQRDIHFHTHYSIEQTIQAMESPKGALTKAAGIKEADVK